MPPNKSENPPSLLREATRADHLILTEIDRAASKAPWPAGVILAELESPDTRTFLSLEPNEFRPVAFAMVSVTGDEARLINIATRPDQQRQGHAMALLARAREVALEHGARYLKLEVRRSNQPAQGLYAGFGFVRIGVKPLYYIATREDAIAMILELAPRKGRLHRERNIGQHT